MSPLLLTIDTALSNLQLALWAWPSTPNDLPICLWQYGSDPGCERTKASMMLPVLQQGLIQAGYQASDIGHLAINCGPGSFTGIRSGMVVARTMGQWFPVQCYAFNSFELIAATIAARQPDPMQPISVTIILNAYRQQHLRAIVSVDPRTGKTAWVEEPVILVNDNAPAESPSSTVWLDETLQPQLGETLYQAEHRCWSDSPDGLLGNDLNAQMALLACQHPERYRRDWDALAPLYYQQPHITLKKTSLSAKTP